MGWIVSLEPIGDTGVLPAAVQATCASPSTAQPLHMCGRLPQQRQTNSWWGEHGHMQDRTISIRDDSMDPSLYNVPKKPII